MLFFFGTDEPNHEDEDEEDLGGPLQQGDETSDSTIYHGYVKNKGRGKNERDTIYDDELTDTTQNDNLPGRFRRFLKLKSVCLWFSDIHM